ncbi:hypothetical protein D915_010829 [Fasciola hepatica]|uniref:TIMELESS-interacting protein n=1 Tax=Fasciola hepatica TaxID=6192 RepID=A0A4E0RAN1_FASHE|nr:hypothetical protein D915_010829 [Fasciola hepatica]
MEIVERLERVGSRREIQTALHRLRNGIWPPYLSAEHVHNSESEDDDHAGGIREPVEIAESGGDEEAAWERALQAMPVQENTLQNEQPRPQCQSPGSDAPSDSFSDLDDVYHPRPSVFNLNESVDKLSETHIPGPSSAVDTTDESRAERNRRLALERLEAKRRSSTQSQTSGSQFKPGKITVHSWSLSFFHTILYRCAP